jgi:endonuclease YncB( thermonuclease family)
MKRQFFVILIILLGPILFSMEAGAQEPLREQKKEQAFPPLPPADFSALREVGGGRVAQVIDAVHLRLDDNRIIQLAATQVPGMNPYAPADSAVAAQDFLKLLVGGQQIKLYESKDSSRRTNRMGFELAQVQVSGVWVQGAMLQRGFARIRPDGDNAEMAKQMIALETPARERKLGLWREPKTAALNAENAAIGLNTLGIVEGTVKSSASVNNTLYLNFDQNWREDFTVSMTPAVRREFSENGIDPLQLTGKRVRAHGWIEKYNGPMIKLSDFAWLEILPDAAEAAKD